MTPKQQLAGLKVLVKRAIVVLDALGDNEMRFQSTGRVWNRAIDDAGMAYGYSETRVRIVPTAREIAQAETVADWLAWLGHHHGDNSVPRLVAWAQDDPIWRIAQRERCSERTIHSRIDRSVAAILAEFGGVEVEVDIVEEGPKAAHAPSFVTDRPMAGLALPISQHGKLWVGGVGWMKNGRRWRNGHDKIEKVSTHAG